MGSQERRDDEGQAGMRLESFGGAAPGPILGSRNEAGPQRLLFHVAAHPQQVSRAAESEDLWPFKRFPCGHGVSSGHANALQMGMDYPIRKSRDPGRGRRAHDKMPCGGHQGIGNEPDWMAVEALAQDREKSSIVVCPEQAMNAARATVHDVKEILRSGFPMCVRHATTSLAMPDRSKPDAASAGSRRVTRSC
jgi:hypothetical protein